MTVPSPSSAFHRCRDRGRSILLAWLCAVGLLAVAGTAMGMFFALLARPGLSDEIILFALVLPYLGPAIPVGAVLPALGYGFDRRPGTLAFTAACLAGGLLTGLAAGPVSLLLYASTGDGNIGAPSDYWRSVASDALPYALCLGAGMGLLLDLLWCLIRPRR